MTEADYASIFEKIIEDTGRHNVRPAKLSKISQDILIRMIGYKWVTPMLAQEINKTTRETSARLFRLKKSGYVKKGKIGWELTVLGEVLAKHLKGSQSPDLMLR